MNIYDELKNEPQKLELFKEADIILENREYSKEECEKMKFMFAQHMMTFSKSKMKEAQEHFSPALKILG